MLRRFTMTGNPEPDPCQSAHVVAMHTQRIIRHSNFRPMIKSLEGVRGIAALIVALYHFQLGTVHAGLPLIRHGYLFVDLFFVLSGFVMCAAYAGKLKSAEDFGRFLIRRTGRLLPLLLFSTLVFLLAADGIVLAKKLAVAHGYGAFLNNPGALQYQVPSVLELLTIFTMTH